MVPLAVIGYGVVVDTLYAFGADRLKARFTADGIGRTGQNKVSYSTGHLFEKGFEIATSNVHAKIYSSLKERGEEA